MSKRVLRGARLVVALSFLALLSSLATGCGRQGRVESPPARIRLAYTKNFNAGLVLIALAKGYFSKEGLDVVAEGSPYGKVALQSLLEGRADIATVADTPFVIAVLGGASISVLSSIQTSNRDEAIVVRRDGGIVKPADLKGKTIGLTRGTTSDYFAYIFLLANGIDIKDVRIVDLGPTEIAEALDLVSGHLAMRRAEIEAIWADFDYQVALDQGLLVDFEDQTRWYGMVDPGRRVEMPNYLDNLYLAGLEAAEPGAVGLIH